MATPAALLANLPAVPGSLWALLAKLSWSDPDLVRAHSIMLGASLQAGAAGGGALSTDGEELTDDAKVVAHKYFLVRRITGYVEINLGVAAEAENAAFVSFQIEDQSREYKLFRESLRMRSIAGNLNVPGIPIEYDEFPLTFLPDSIILVTFTPLSGLGIAASSSTGLTTRRVELELHGVLVSEALVESLIEANAEALRKSGLLRPRSERR